MKGTREMIEECPFCGSNRIVETLKGGTSICLACESFLNNKSKHTLFDRITASPEVLAEKSVYAHECCRIPDGITSPFIDTIFWFEDEKGDTWDERFDSAWEKALSATVAKLKEVENG